MMPTRQAEEIVERAHPLGVAFGQVIVDGDDVDAAPGERVQVDRQRRDERLAFAGAHLGDVAFVQHLAAHDLHVEVAHAQDRACRPRGRPRTPRAADRRASRPWRAARGTRPSSPPAARRRARRSAGSSALTRSAVLRSRITSRSLPSKSVLRKAILGYNRSADRAGSSRRLSLGRQGRAGGVVERPADRAWCSRSPRR